MSANRVNDLPNFDRPREKMQKYGPTRLSDEELVAIILRTGRKGRNAIQIAGDILGLYRENIKTVDLNTLMSIDGLGLSKSAQIIACFELGRRFYLNPSKKSIMNPDDAWREMSEYSNTKKEHFVCMYLDSRHQLLSKEIISIGTVDSSLVHPREVFEPALRLSASSIVIAHNHPSGVLEASLNDIEVTRRLQSAGNMLGIKIIDHVIVTPDSYISIINEC